MSTERSSDVGTIAGFWQRVGAFLVDCVLLGAIGTVAGLFLTDEFARRRFFRVESHNRGRGFSNNRVHRAADSSRRSALATHRECLVHRSRFAENRPSGVGRS